MADSKEDSLHQPQILDKCEDIRVHDSDVGPPTGELKVICTTRPKFERLYKPNHSARTKPDPVIDS